MRGIALWGVCAAAVLVSTPVLARAPDSDQLAAQAKARIADGSVDPARDLAPVLEALRTSRKDSEQARLLLDIDEIGSSDGTSPAAVKAWLKLNAPPVLLDVGRSASDWSVRGSALMALRSIGADDDVLDRAIAIAEADSNNFVRSRGALLRQWRGAHTSTDARSAPPQPGDAAAEQRALEFLRRRSANVSLDGLAQAAMDGDVEVVRALFDAGVRAKQADEHLKLLDSAAEFACAHQGFAAQKQEAVLDALIAHGVDIGAVDALGNTALIGAVQSCPPEIVAKLLALGAKPDPVNAQRFTPLKMALVSGHWVIADVLIGKGARISKKDADSLFFEAPTDPGQRAVLARALAK